MQRIADGASVKQNLSVAERYLKWSFLIMNIEDVSSTPLLIESNGGSVVIGADTERVLWSTTDTGEGWLPLVAGGSPIIVDYDVYVRSGGTGARVIFGNIAI